MMLSALGATLRAALMASSLRGALPPANLRAVCLLLAMRGQVFRSSFGLETLNAEIAE